MASASSSSQPARFDWGKESALVVGSHAVGNSMMKSDRRQHLSMAADDLELAQKAVADATLDSLDDMRNFVQRFAKDSLQSTELEQLRRQEYAEHIIGCGFVRFAGLELIDEAVLLSGNPNNRPNPRQKSDNHVANLKESIQQSKVDWRFPIVLCVSETLVDPSDLKKLRQSTPFQQFSEPPLFKLNNLTPRERHLRVSIFWEHEDGTSPTLFLTQEQLQSMRSELSKLSCDRPRAQLVNGGHRIHAMRQIAEVFEPLRQDVITLQKRYFREQDKSVENELREKSAELMAAMNRYTWQVLVFKDTTPTELLQELARNHQATPQLGPLPGEQVWMHACRIEAMYHRLKDIFSNDTHPELMDRCHSELLSTANSRSLAGGNVEHEQGDGRALETSGNDAGKGKAKASKVKSAKVKGSSEGAEMYQRITTEPVLLEMMLHTKACMWAYTSLLSRAQVTTMMQPMGGAFAANFWIALDLLQKLANTPDPEPFNQLPQLLKRFSPDIFKGHGEVVQAWRTLHTQQDRIGYGLQFYDSTLAGDFDVLWKGSFSLKKSDDDASLLVDWDQVNHITKVRLVFEAWGKHLFEEYTSVHIRRMGLVARLYARLPLWSHRMVSAGDYGVSDLRSDDCFYPRARLPTKELVGQWSRTSQSLRGLDAGVEVLEFLTGRHRHMWTMGSGDPSTRLNSNWYYSGRGTLFVLLKFVEDHSLGCMAARLDTALTWLDDLNFHRAIAFVHAAVDPSHMVTQMKSVYGAKKSVGLGISPQIFEGRTQRLHLTGVTSTEYLVQKLTKEGRQAILEHIEHGDPAELGTVLKANPCLHIISDEFWNSAPVIWWGSAWEQSSRKRLLSIAGCVIGWGLLEDAYHDYVVKPLLLHRRAYMLAEVASQAHRGQDEPWWGDLYELRQLRLWRREVLGASEEEVPSDDDSESDPEDTEHKYENVHPLTGPGPLEAWVTKPSIWNAHLTPRSTPQPVPPSPEHFQEFTTPPDLSGQSTPAIPLPFRQLSSVSRDPSPQPSSVCHSALQKRSDAPQPSWKPSAEPQQEGTTTPSSPQSQRHSLPDSTRSRHTQQPQSRPPTPEVQELEVAYDKPTPSGLNPHMSGSEGERGPLPSNTSTFPVSLGGPELEPSNLHVWAVDTSNEQTRQKQLWTGRFKVRQLIAKQSNPRQIVKVLGDLGIQTTETREAIRRKLDSLPGFVTTGFLTDRFLPGYAGQVLPYRGEDITVETVEAEIDTVIANTHKAIDLAFQLSRDLRDDMTNAAIAVFQHSYPPLQLLGNLVPQLNHLCISFVQRLALEISNLGIPMDDALAEAVLLSNDDGLFDVEPVVWLDDGDVLLDFGGTFPAVDVGETRVRIGKVEKEITPGLLQLSRSCFTCTGQGDTRAAAMINGVHGGVVQALQVVALGQNSSVAYDANKQIRELQNEHDTRWEAAKSLHRMGYGGRGSPLAAANEIGVGLTTWDDSRPTIQGVQSCLARGPFCGTNPVWISKRKPPNKARLYLNKIVEAAEVLKAHRESAEAADLKHFHEHRHKVEALAEERFWRNPSSSPSPAYQRSTSIGTVVSQHLRQNVSPMRGVESQTLNPPLSTTIPASEQPPTAQLGSQPYQVPEQPLPGPSRSGKKRKERSDDVSGGRGSRSRDE